VKQILENKGGHWYDVEGNPMHLTKYTSGKRKGQLRPTTLRDAKKLRLFPSITSILGEYPKKSLERWIKEQVMLAMHNNPASGPAAAPCESFKEADESQIGYFRYIEDLSNLRRDQAAKRGTFIHDNIEAMLLGKTWDEQDAHLRAVKNWVDDNVTSVELTEHNVVDAGLGVAGRLDACVRLKGSPSRVVLDYKGRGFNELKTGSVRYKAKKYKTDTMQLTFYAKCIGAQRIANLYVSNDRPEPVIEFNEWTEEEHAAAYVTLKHFIKVWQYEHGYNPSEGVGFTL
jgi:hypothetical protein